MATTVDRYPVGDYDNSQYWYNASGPNSGYTNLYASLDDWSDTGDYVYPTSWGWSQYWANVNSPSVPTGSTNINVQLYIYYAFSDGCGAGGGVYGTIYQGATYSTSLYNSSGWSGVGYTWSVHPGTGTAWTVSQVNSIPYIGLYGYYYYIAPDPKYGGGCTTLPSVASLLLRVNYDPLTAKVYAFGCGVGTVVGSKSTSIG